MEDWQFEYINQNLGQLTQATKFTKALLHELRNGKVLDDQDLKVLDKERESHGDRADTSKLYAMLQMRPNAYQGLLTALQKVNQRLPAEILEKGWNLHQIEHFTPLIPPKIFHDKPEKAVGYHSKNNGNKTADPEQHGTSFKVRGSFSILGATAAAATFTSVFFTVYFIYYINLTILVSIAISSAIGLLLLALNLKLEFSRATLFLIAPELTARTARIGFVHLLMILSPLPHLQSNSEQFMGSIVCTTEKALNVAQNSSEGVLRNAMGGVQGSIQSINQLSHQIERVISGPLDTFGNIVGGVESVIGEIGKMEQHCNQAKNGVSQACRSILDLPGGACRGIPAIGRRRKRNIFGNIRDKFQDVGDKIKGGVTTGVGLVVGGFNTGVHATQNGVQQGLNGARDGLMKACNSVKGISSQCSHIQNLNMCSVFSPILGVQRKIREFKQKAVEGVKERFRFRLEANSGGNSSVNAESLSEIKNSFKENVQSKIDFFLAFQRIWGFILCLSLLYLVISKALLVRKYVKKQKIRCKPVSLFFLVTNPFTLQVCFLFLIGMLDYSIYLINDIFRSSILANEIQLGVEFNASVTTTGGDIGKQIAGGIIRAFELYKSENVTVSFEECFEKEMDPPNWLGYLMAFGLSGIGLVTYVVDMHSRKRQREIIQFAYNRHY